MEFSNNNPNNLSLAEIREEAYKQGREETLQYILERGGSLLESDKLTSEMVFGICLIMGIVKAQTEKERMDEAD